MGRRIVTSQFQSSGAGFKVDTYFDRVVKYIPADVVAAWTAAMGLINSTPNIPHSTIFWIAFIIGVVLTALWTLKQTTEPKKRPAITQTAIAVGSFTIWVIALGGPFATLTFYNSVYGSLLLIMYSLVVGLVIPAEG